MHHFISLVALAAIATPTSIPVEATLSEVSLVQIQQEQTTIKSNFQLLDLKPPKLNLEVIKESTPPKVLIGSDYKSQITYWCSFYGCNPNTLYNRMMCESTGRPNARNGIYIGLYQYSSRTFYAYAPKAGIANPNINSPSHQIQAATYMDSIGESRHWSCK